MEVLDQLENCGKRRQNSVGARWGVSSLIGPKHQPRLDPVEYAVQAFSLYGCFAAALRMATVACSRMGCIPFICRFKGI